jgi:acetamidase/formamidase
MMGGGEITGTALETSGDVTVTVLPGGTGRLTLPHLDDDKMIGGLGCHRDVGLERNLEAAMLGTHRRLVAEHGLAPADAYQLVGATARVLVNQCVAPPTWSTVYVGVPGHHSQAAAASPVMLQTASDSLAGSDCGPPAGL